MADEDARPLESRTPLVSDLVTVCRAERTFFIRHALRAGFTVEKIFNFTKIDGWFLVQIREFVDSEQELANEWN